MEEDIIFRDWSVPVDLPDRFIRNVEKQDDIYACIYVIKEKGCWYELFDIKGKYIGQHIGRVLCEDLDDNKWENLGDKCSKYFIQDWTPDKELYVIDEKGKLIYKIGPETDKERQKNVQEFGLEVPINYKIYKGSYDEKHIQELDAIYKSNK